jgi:sensor histidine kinase YesM
MYRNALNNLERISEEVKKLNINISYFIFRNLRFIQNVKVNH